MEGHEDLKARLVLALAFSAACRSQSVQPGAPAFAERIEVEDAGAASTPPVDAESKGEPKPEAATVRFAWRPPGGDEAAYAMSDSEDRHRVVILGRDETRSYPVVIALHGQPKRGQAPRTYAFPGRVIEVASDLVARGDVVPFVLALPVFRFGGVDWPNFDLAAFRSKVEEVLAAQGLGSKDFYVVGHSGAAGCGGDGMNRAHRLRPAAVGFFDTCLGAGWRDEIRALQRARVPVWIFQSVETAGVQPRHLREYDGRYDFGQVFRTVGLAPVGCAEHVPDAPLRAQPYRCAADAEGRTRAFVVDTGEGDAAHEALVSVAFAHFLREELPARTSKR